MTATEDKIYGMTWVLKVCFHTMWSGWCEEMVERINLETRQDLSKVQLLLIKHVQPDFLFSTRFFSTFWDTMQRNARYFLCLQMKYSIINITRMVIFNHWKLYIIQVRLGIVAELTNPFVRSKVLEMLIQEVRNCIYCDDAMTMWWLLSSPQMMIIIWWLLSLPYLLFLVLLLEMLTKIG